MAIGSATPSFAFKTHRSANLGALDCFRVSVQKHALLSDELNFLSLLDISKFNMGFSKKTCAALNNLLHIGIPEIAETTPNLEGIHLAHALCP